MTIVFQSEKGIRRIEAKASSMQVVPAVGDLVTAAGIVQSAIENKPGAIFGHVKHRHFEIRDGDLQKVTLTID